MITLGGRHQDSQGQSSSVATDAGRIFDDALFSALDALDEAKVSYAVIGGIAASNLGRPRSTQDIDIFVRPEDAEAILKILERAGFRTEETNPSWLFKAFKHEVLIDIIFRSEGGFYYDDEMRKRSVTVKYHGRDVRLVSPEDFVLIKCAVHSEEGPHHWHDALAVLSQSRIDWDYLLSRARKAPRRLLAHLIYAQADDIWVPNMVIQKLYHQVFEQQPATPSAAPPLPPPAPAPAESKRPAPNPDAYLGEKIREALAQSERSGALGVNIWVQDRSVLVRGQCQSEEEHLALLLLIKEMAPGYEISDQVNITSWSAPVDVKDIQ